MADINIPVGSTYTSAASAASNNVPVSEADVITIELGQEGEVSEVTYCALSIPRSSLTGRRLTINARNVGAGGSGVGKFGLYACGETGTGDYKGPAMYDVLNEQISPSIADFTAGAYEYLGLEDAASGTTAFPVTLDAPTIVEAFSANHIGFTYPASYPTGAVMQYKKWLKYGGSSMPQFAWDNLQEGHAVRGIQNEWTTITEAAEFDIDDFAGDNNGAYYRMYDPATGAESPTKFYPGDLMYMIGGATTQPQPVNASEAIPLSRGFLPESTDAQILITSDVAYSTSPTFRTDNDYITGGCFSGFGITSPSKTYISGTAEPVIWEAEVQNTSRAQNGNATLAYAKGSDEGSEGVIFDWRMTSTNILFMVAGLGVTAEITFGDSGPAQEYLSVTEYDPCLLVPVVRDPFEVPPHFANLMYNGQVILGGFELGGASSSDLCDPYFYDVLGLKYNSLLWSDIGSDNFYPGTEYKFDQPIPDELRLMEGGQWDFAQQTSDNTIGFYNVHNGGRIIKMGRLADNVIIASTNGLTLMKPFDNIWGFREISNITPYNPAGVAFGDTYGIIINESDRKLYSFSANGELTEHGYEYLFNEYEEGYCSIEWDSARKFFIIVISYGTASERSYIFSEHGMGGLDFEIRSVVNIQGQSKYASTYGEQTTAFDYSASVADVNTKTPDIKHLNTLQIDAYNMNTEALEETFLTCQGYPLFTQQDTTISDGPVCEANAEGYAYLNMSGVRFAFKISTNSPCEINDITLRVQFEDRRHVRGPR